MHPGTKQPIGPEDLAPIFAMELIKQEVSQERWIDIPEPVLELAAEIEDADEKTSPNVVKVVGSHVGQAVANRMRALYFTRATAPAGDGPLYHHIGIYGYRRAALERFVSLPPSPLEKREKLEQLRALEHGMRIEVAIVDTVPLGVDTPADLERARKLLAPNDKQ